MTVLAALAILYAMITGCVLFVQMLYILQPEGRGKWTQWRRQLFVDIAQRDLKRYYLYGVGIVLADVLFCGAIALVFIAITAAIIVIMLVQCVVTAIISIAMEGCLQNCLTAIRDDCMSCCCGIWSQLAPPADEFQAPQPRAPSQVTATPHNPGGHDRYETLINIAPTVAEAMDVNTGVEMDAENAVPTVAEYVSVNSPQ